jgi:hypothetical protein
LTINGLGFVLGDSFANSSGKPEQDNQSVITSLLYGKKQTFLKMYAFVPMPLFLLSNTQTMHNKPIEYNSIAITS